MTASAHNTRARRGTSRVSRLGVVGVIAGVLSACGGDDANRTAAPGAVSASTSTVSVSADAVPVGHRVTITVVPRDAKGLRLGRNQAVSITVGDDASTGQLSAVRYFAYDSSYRATWVPMSPDRALAVRARVGAVALAATRTIAVRVALPLRYSFCANMGETCTFSGVREVRLISDDGPVYTQTLPGPVLCMPGEQSRAFSGAPPAVYSRCEIGDPKVDEMANAVPGRAGLDAAVLVVPVGDAGSPQALVRGEGQPLTAAAGEGSFRQSCQFARMAFFDPVTSPAVTSGAPLRQFFGNAGVAATSTPATLATSGNGTCTGGTANRSAYWSPAVFDVRTSEVIPPDFVLVYHKTGFNMDPALVRAFPTGLVMVAGQPRNVDVPQLVRGLPVTIWDCEVTAWTNTGAVPTCPVGDVVQLTVSFPQCWDGAKLDAPDHQAHMAYPVFRAPPQRSSCPATHPVPIPAITLVFRWPVTAGMDPAYWRLTSDTYPLTTRGGYSAHATWMNGWTPEFLQVVMTNCLQPGRDCGVNLLGDGRALY